MAKLTNTGKQTAIGLPDGTYIAPGATVDVPAWDKFKDRPNLAFYVKERVLKVDADGKASGGDADEQERAGLMAELQARGVEVKGNPKTETLRQRLEEAKKEQAGNPPNP